MKRNKKKNIKLLSLALLLLLGIGFAALAANLKINGTVNIDSASWDVHFENVSITEGSVEANPAPTTNNTDTTEMTYAINFEKPGDFFEFTTDIVNAGTIDAMVNLMTNKIYDSTGTTEKTLPNYLTSSVTYSNGVEIKINQLLAKQTSEKIKVRVEFRSDVDARDLPSTNETTIFKFSGTFKQADENAKPLKSKFELGELVYFDPVNSNECSENTFDLEDIINGTSTCYKWRVLDVDDEKSKERVTLQLDHNLIESERWSSISTTDIGPDILLQSLATATSNWSKVPLLNYTYDSRSTASYQVLTCENGNCKISKTGNTIASNVRARVVTTEEAKKMVQKVSGTYPTSDNYYYISSTDEPYKNPIGTTLSWFFENTKEEYRSKATNNIYGNPSENYWSLSVATPSQYNSLYVSYYGEFEYAFPSNQYGIRPVIEIEKSKLN